MQLSIPASRPAYFKKQSASWRTLNSQICIGLDKFREKQVPTKIILKEQFANSSFEKEKSFSLISEAL
jgi:hypothetical protein